MLVHNYIILEKVDNYDILMQLKNDLHFAMYDCLT